VNDTTITIIGNLTDNPDLRLSAQGVALVRFTVASTPRVYDREAGGYRDGDPLFLPCTAWRDVAENLAESLTKGARVIVTGRLTQSSWQTDTGERRTGYTVQVEEIGPSLRFATATVTTKTSRRPADAA
jgi:single-strand DNA-binding protein